MPVRAILTDIEGTTSSIHFVHQVLFPYSAKAMLGFLQSVKQRSDSTEQVLKQRSDSTEQSRQQLQALTAIDQLASETGIARDNLGALNDQLLAWIKADVKHPILKSLQGMIWQQGYEQGAYRGHVYPEVADCLRAWQARGLLLYVYSSGSVFAQKLLFGHSAAGDLTPLFNGYFDTAMGHKRELISYQNIARRIGLITGQILFLSDIVEELDAARAAGMHTMQLLREPTPQALALRHPSAHDFSQISC